MKKILVIIVMLISMLDADAQFQIGIKGGLNVTRVSVSSSLINNVAPENREGYFMGLTARCPLFVLPLTIDASALYNKTSVGLGNVTVTRELLCVPVNAELNVSRHFFVFAGPQLDFDISDEDYSLSHAVETVQNFSLHDADVSVNLGAGVKVSHLQFTVNFNKACGSLGDFKFKDALGEVGDVFSGSAKADSWWLGLTYFF